MTTEKEIIDHAYCPAEVVLKYFSGKWKLQIFRLSVRGPLRFSSLLKQLKGSNKQSVTVALREMELDDLLERKVIRLKPLHVEYLLTEKGKSLVPLFHFINTLK